MNGDKCVSGHRPLYEDQVFLIQCNSLFRLTRTGRCSAALAHCVLFPLPFHGSRGFPRGNSCGAKMLSYCTHIVQSRLSYGTAGPYFRVSKIDNRDFHSLRHVWISPCNLSYNPKAPCDAPDLDLNQPWSTRGSSNRVGFPGSHPIPRIGCIHS